jgi:hypothetical protein
VQTAQAAQAVQAAQAAHTAQAAQAAQAEQVPAQEAHAQHAAQAAPQVASYWSHVAGNNQTVAQIATMRGLEVSDLLKFNLPSLPGLTKTAKLYSGTRIWLRGPPMKAAAIKTSSSLSSFGSFGSNSTSSVGGRGRVCPPGVKDGEGRVHMGRGGDFVRQQSKQL